MDKCKGVLFNMKKIIFTRNNDKGLSIVFPMPKHKIEEILGPLTDQEYRDHIYERSIPADAIKVREIDDSIIPQDWTHRDSWCDVTPEECIDIDVSKARDIQLNKIEKKKAQYNNLDVPHCDLSPETRQKIERLNIISNSLRSLDVKDKFNDETLLNEIKRLGDQ